MEYIVALLTLVHLIFLYLYWMRASSFKRGLEKAFISALAFIGIAMWLFKIMP